MHLKRQVRRTLAAEHAVQLERDPHRRRRCTHRVRRRARATNSHAGQCSDRRARPARHRRRPARRECSDRQALGRRRCWPSSTTCSTCPRPTRDAWSSTSTTTMCAAASREVIDTLEPMAASKGIALRLPLDRRPAPRPDHRCDAPAPGGDATWSRTRSTSRPPERCASTRWSSPRTIARDVAITVRDTGVGIPAALIDTVFEPYEQAHTATGARWAPDSASRCASAWCRRWAARSS